MSRKVIGSPAIALPIAEIPAALSKIGNRILRIVPLPDFVVKHSLTHPAELGDNPIARRMRSIKSQLLPLPIRACLIWQSFEHCTQWAGTTDPRREEQPQRRPPSLQFEAFGINTDATPVAVGCAKQLGGVKPASVRMVSIHMRDRVSLRFDERPCIGNIGQDVLRLEIDDTAEAGHEMRAGDINSIEREVREIRESFRFGATPQ